MLKTPLSLLLLAALAAFLLAGCGNRWQPNSGPRFAVTCQGTPTAGDYLETQRGDLLINGEKCKCFRMQGKPAKRPKVEDKDEHSS